MVDGVPCIGVLDVVFGCLGCVHPAHLERKKRPWCSRLGATFRPLKIPSLETTRRFLHQERFFEAAQDVQWRLKRLWVERQLAPVGVTSRKKVTKGNKVLASGALSGASEGIELIARGAFIYQPERVIGAETEVVRDTGFEHVAPNWEQFQKKDPVRSNGAL